jgi:predicted metal-dependent phosphotriesterase family hydrolase
MATVETVNGQIDVEELGLTLIHEHFFSSDEAVTAQWPHVRDRDREFELALESAEAI